MTLNQLDLSDAVHMPSTDFRLVRFRVHRLTSPVAAAGGAPAAPPITTAASDSRSTEVATESDERAAPTTWSVKPGSMRPPNIRRPPCPKITGANHGLPPASRLAQHASSAGGPLSGRTAISRVRDATVPGDSPREVVAGPGDRPLDRWSLSKRPVRPVGVVVVEVDGEDPVPAIAPVPRSASGRAVRGGGCRSTARRPRSPAEPEPGCARYGSPRR